MKYTILIILCIVIFPAYAEEWNSLQGTYAITGEHLIDPDPKEKNNTHIRLALTGQTAKDLYDAMQVEPKINECTETLSKQIDNMICYHGKTSAQYECDFSINIKKQTVEHGLVC